MSTELSEYPDKNDYSIEDNVKSVEVTSSDEESEVQVVEHEVIVSDVTITSVEEGGCWDNCRYPDIPEYHFWKYHNDRKVHNICSQESGFTDDNCWFIFSVKWNSKIIIFTKILYWVSS